MFWKLRRRSYGQSSESTKIRREVEISCTVLLLVAALVAQPAVAASYRTEVVNVRGVSQTLAVYEPAGDAPRRPVQVIVTSGDVGWIGLPVDIAAHLQKLGYRTIGFNARAYLASFTGRADHLNERDIPQDYEVLYAWASQNAYPKDFVVIGVSEGAGLAVLGVAQQGSKRCKGVIALGVPERTSLGWRWTDFPMWITKRDPKEPQADTGPFLARMHVPLVMIHSTRDEWDAIDRARVLYSSVPAPKKFIAIDAVNHRFSDKVPEVLDHIGEALLWLQGLSE